MKKAIASYEDMWKSNASRHVSQGDQMTALQQQYQNAIVKPPCIGFLSPSYQFARVRLPADYVLLAVFGPDVGAVLCAGFTVATFRVFCPGLDNQRAWKGLTLDGLVMIGWETNMSATYGLMVHNVRRAPELQPMLRSEYDAALSWVKKA